MEGCSAAGLTEHDDECFPPRAWGSGTMGSGAANEDVLQLKASDANQRKVEVSCIPSVRQSVSR